MLFERRSVINNPLFGINLLQMNSKMNYEITVTIPNKIIKKKIITELSHNMNT